MTDHEEDPCDCHDPDCGECNQGIVDQAEEDAMDEHYVAIEQREEHDLQRQLEGGDDDDGDEEDLNGSHPIDDPDDTEDN